MDNTTFLLDRSFENISFMLNGGFENVVFTIDEFGFFDQIIGTTVSVDLETGNLVWVVQDNLSEENSTILSLNEDGSLISSSIDNASFVSVILGINLEKYLIAII